MAFTVGTNSYISVADANTYFLSRVGSDNWDSANIDAKEAALVTATAMIDNQAWIGSAVSSSQDLAWPRDNATYNDYRLGHTITIANNVTPQEVLDAVCEQALHLLDNPTLLKGLSQTFESVSVGPISISDSNNDVYRQPTTSYRATNLIRNLISTSGKEGMGATWWRRW